jgi:hypothetical protein
MSGRLKVPSRAMLGGGAIFVGSALQMNRDQIRSLSPCPQVANIQMGRACAPWPRDRGGGEEARTCSRREPRWERGGSMSRSGTSNFHRGSGSARQRRHVHDCPSRMPSRRRVSRGLRARPPSRDATTPCVHGSPARPWCTTRTRIEEACFLFDLSLIPNWLQSASLKVSNAFGGREKKKGFGVSLQYVHQS